MFGRCKHPDWKVISKTFTGPDARPTRVKNISEELMTRMMFGQTNIAQQCQVCHKTEIITVPGRVNDGPSV